MRLLLRIIGFAILGLVLLAAGVVADLAFNHKRLIYAALGREALEAACRPALITQLAAAGFEPNGVEFGDEPDIALSSVTGKTLAGPFTFQDGASQARVDGSLVCSVSRAGVHVVMRTRATPLRAA